MKSIYSFIIGSLFFVLISKAFGGPTTFGAEFTFTNQEIINAQTEPHIVDNDQAVRYQKLFAEALIASCKGCTVEKVLNKYEVENYKFTYSNGLIVTISTDPSCIEVQTSAITSNEIAKNVDVLQKDLFELAEKIGLRPSPTIGGGHIHFGWLSATNGDLLLTRNIIVDFMNHPELAQGIFSVSRFNAPPLAYLPQEYQDNFKKIISDLDKGKFKTVRNLIRRIEREVYNYNEKGWDPPEKYHDLNVSRIESKEFDKAEMTFEARFILAQRNAHEYAAITKLFDGRIEFLRSLNRPIPVDIPNLASLSDPEKYLRFSKYVSESGEDFGKFRKKVALVKPQIAQTTPVFSPQKLVPIQIRCESLLMAH